MTDDAGQRRAEEARRLERLKRVFFRSEEFKQALAGIDNLRLNGLMPNGDAMCYLLYGPPGVGKSWVFKEVMKQDFAQPDPTTGSRPVVLMTVPSPFTNTDMLADTLRALGTEPLRGRQKVGDMIDRVQHYIHVRRTELILMEEMQHVFDKKSENSGAAYWFADFIKTNLLDQAKVKVAFNGIDAAWRVFDNPQLEDRRYDSTGLSPLGWSEDRGWDPLRVVVASFERAADFPERGDILNDATLERFSRATGGALRQLFKLFAKTIELGTRSGADRIDAKLLALAHAALARPHPKWFNAFSVPVLPPVAKPDESRVTKLRKKRAS
ncbi:ATP-binding protein [Belnapia sp. F-4-1]|uniref:ATP-binding protein n=1 Tax=Belnapia sp. F-4-1 TaxID=1545443 RepID=UPI0005B903D8|nr:ATP-binding protein [Belnapia sp. F-4-1]